MIVIVIPAKSSSSRLANKNMVEINERPMLDYSIDQALASQKADAIYVTTDGEAIAKHAEARGIKTIHRPQELCGDAPIIDVYRHAVHQIDGDVTVVVGLQPDHPDRDVSIDETLEILARENADRVMSTEADGTKNGAHYVLSRHYIDTEESRKDVTIIDDCTNIHYEEDLARASGRLTPATTETKND
jgi:CMP-N-acetylneuraminic acid synthetase